MDTGKKGNTGNIIFSKGKYCKHLPSFSRVLWSKINGRNTKFLKSKGLMLTRSTIDAHRAAAHSQFKFDDVIPVGIICVSKSVDGVTQLLQKCWLFYFVTCCRWQLEMRTWSIMSNIKQSFFELQLKSTCKIVKHLNNIVCSCSFKNTILQNTHTCFGVVVGILSSRHEVRTMCQCPFFFPLSHVL